MVDEPENMTLRMLGEIRAKQDDHEKRFDARFDSLETRFDNLETRFEEMRLYVNHALGLGTANDIRLREHEARLKSEEARRKRMDADFAELERRLHKVEDEPRA